MPPDAMRSDATQTVPDAMRYGEIVEPQVPDAMRYDVCRTTGDVCRFAQKIPDAMRCEAMRSDAIPKAATEATMRRYSPPSGEAPRDDETR